MYYYTYLIIPTNKDSEFYGHVYFGQHQTEFLDDNYTGSGKLICRYINKHPNDYYKEIIKFYNSQEELNKAEYELIHPHLGKDYCMNLVEGGSFGRLHPDLYTEIGKKISIKNKELWNDQEYREKLTKKRKEVWDNPEYREQQSKVHKDYYINNPERCKEISVKQKEYHSRPEVRKFYSEINSGSNNFMYGKNYRDYMTEEAKEIQGKKQSNQMKGRRHLSNGIDHVFIKEELWNEYLNKGYHFGYK
jgi:hypothetical protein